MVRPGQFSLGYLLLEVFWIAVTLALAREAYWLQYHCRGFYWNPPEAEVRFAALVVMAIISGSTAVGGVFHRMELGALVAVTGVASLFLVWVVGAIVL